MMNRKVNGILSVFGVAFILLFAEALCSAQADDNWVDSDLHFANFQIGLIGATGEAGGFSGSILGRYLPEYVFKSNDRQEKHFGTGLDLGITGFGTSDSSTVMVYEYGGFGAYHLDANWDVRLLFGAQTWAAGIGTAFFLGPEVLYHFDSGPKLLGIDGVFASYNRVFLTNAVNLMSVGIHFNL